LPAVLCSQLSVVCFFVCILFPADYPLFSVSFFFLFFFYFPVAFCTEKRYFLMSGLLLKNFKKSAKKLDKKFKTVIGCYAR